MDTEDYYTEKFYDGLLGEDVIIDLGARLPVVKIEHKAVKWGGSFFNAGSTPVPWLVNGSLISIGHRGYNVEVFVDHKKVAKIIVLPREGINLISETQKIATALLQSAIRSYYLRKTREKNCV